MGIQTEEQLQTVTATLNYLRPTAAKPVNYTFEPPPGVPWQSGAFDPQTVRIRDVRPVAAGLSLDRQGFAVINAPSSFTRFDDPSLIKSRYYPETERMLQEHTGAARVIVFDHNLRNGARAAAGEAGIREPVKRVHNDFTAGSGLRRAQDELIARGLDPGEVVRNRFAMINLWRPVSRVVEEAPLALCDATSMGPGDFVATDLVFPQRVGEVYSVTFSPGHRWFYAPRLDPAEALLIKCFDSAEDGRARFTAHTAFDDPTSPADAPPRESIEARALVIFASEHSGGYPNG